MKRRRATKLTETLLSTKAKPKRITSAVRILGNLRQEIMTLQRPPGSAINEKEIATAYSVSRTPVREALLKLSEEGLVDIFPQSGTFVSRIPLFALRENIVVRQALEMMSARLAAANANEETCLQLDETMRQIKLAAETADNNMFHEADEAFHAIIADIAGYPALWRISQSVKSQMDRCRRLTLPQAGRLQRIISEHQSVVDAIRKKDAEAASRQMAEHLEKLIADLDGIRDLDPDYFISDPQ
ncbi:GntR family transcriptional regulator [Microvirga sp. W0021]|uniref:GntR family transcriptional regulator n=1 Tax=Hohaiivirga grylli TaxID=3133970 RepID=A0ABV0BIR0_9HYPH